MQIYVVQPGDSLWQVARQFGMTVAEVASANGLIHPSQLVVGQALVLPTPENLYVVQSGDTLADIAHRYHTSISELAKQNVIAQPNQIGVGQVLQIPDFPKPRIETNAYLTDFQTPGQATTANVAWFLTYLSPFSYHVTAQGGLVPLSDAAVLSTALQRQTTPLLVITNWLGQMFSSDVAHEVLNSETIQATLMENIFTVLRTHGYGGLNIDFEYVYPQDKDAYNRFLERLVGPLHTAGYTLSTALAPKVSATEQGLLYEAHDYPVHGRLTDFVILMTYEWGWA
ncbi:LysM peptidoglycan-binding domain-containing protein, partial [Alicyclobacillaceae bacterium I2511]